MNRREFIKALAGAVAGIPFLRKLLPKPEVWRKSPLHHGYTDGKYFIGADYGGPNGDYSVVAVWEDLGGGQWWLKGFRRLPLDVPLPFQSSGVAYHQAKHVPDSLLES